ncbi:hypothetical protein RND71_044170 [Anisodus tanguticus]|uniref:Major facilitator superfamily (MFS) profile domain-containing protein n=1 Tax=Anisodus tanguticus TaxID=243964 RepID=A0AAE1QNR7_9SOLA|nr:hypothetical protein RND71_044170 [Anisodus tanguticus]
MDDFHISETSYLNVPDRDKSLSPAESVNSSISDLSTLPISAPRRRDYGGLTRRLVFAIGAAAFGSAFQHGYNTGVVNAPQVLVSEFINETYHDRFGVSPPETRVKLIYSIIVSLFCVGGMIGALMTAFVADKFGRKGLAPMYLAEISPIHLRGAIGTIYQLVITISILLSNILGLPGYLGRDINAQKALIWLRGTIEVHDEMDEMRGEYEKMRLVTKLSGINAAISFSTDIFKSAGLNDTSALYSTMGSIPWFLVAELFGAGARGLATSVSVATNWGANFVVSLAFLPLKRVPETKGKTVDDIAAMFRQKAYQLAGHDGSQDEEGAGQDCAGHEGAGHDSTFLMTLK